MRRRGDNRAKKRKGHQGTFIKNPWTKSREGGIRGGRWGWLGWGSGGRKMQTTVLEQQ